MKKILLFLCFVFLTLIPVYAHAGPPDCGEIDREDVLDDTYSDARKLKYLLIDIRDDIDLLCNFMEKWHVWEKDEASDEIVKDDDEYEKAREILIRRVLGDVRELGNSIMVYVTWKEVDATSSIMEAKQIAYMKKSYDYMSNFRDLAMARGAEIDAMMHWTVSEEPR